MTKKASTRKIIEFSECVIFCENYYLQNKMAKFRKNFTVIFVFLVFNAWKTICTPLQKTDFGDFYLNRARFFNDKNDRSILLHPIELQGWPKTLTSMGQVAGVAVNLNHQPVIFHRGQRVWDDTTFNESHHFNHILEGPIPEDTVLTLDPDTGEVISSWGKNFFYLPHGLTIDNYGYYYMTDIALHQAFKFKAGSKTPSLVFGQKFEPGSGLHHLCKPTDVAVASSGEIFIADGYCNSRIMKYDSNGNLLYVLPQNEEFLQLKIPHSITLIEDLDVVCIADRENERVICPGAGLKNTELETNPIMIIKEQDMGRVFAIASYGYLIFAVNGPSLPMVQIRGLTIDPTAESIMDQWTSSEGFQNPHDIEICHNTSSLYVVETTPSRIWKFRLIELY